MLKTYSKLLQNTVRTISNWKNENRPIITLLEKYFTKKDLEEFLDTGKISKFELLNKNNSTLTYAGIQYIDIFKKRLVSIGDIINKDFMDIYFNALIFAKNDIVKQSVFKPFTISKATLIYLSRNNTEHKSSDNEVIPKLEAGFERLEEFDCYTNQFLLSNILQSFEPMIQVIENGLLDKNEKAEAYLHAILFHLYNEHQDKKAEQKREIFVDVFIAMLQANNKNNTLDIAMNEDNTSLDTLVRSNLELVEKNYDKIIEAIKSYT
ncbi:MAG: hypothetical protein PHE73_09285 [Sulfurovaceae bacterium]|nr:hypothetical protein [Sulfurovaceae bacterium]